MSRFHASCPRVATCPCVCSRGYALRRWQPRLPKQVSALLAVWYLASEWRARRSEKKATTPLVDAHYVSVGRLLSVLTTAGGRATGRVGGPGGQPNTPDGTHAAAHQVWVATSHAIYSKQLCNHKYGPWVTPGWTSPRLTRIRHVSHPRPLGHRGLHATHPPTLRASSRAAHTVIAASPVHAPHGARRHACATQTSARAYAYVRGGSQASEGAPPGERVRAPHKQPRPGPPLSAPPNARGYEPIAANHASHGAHRGPLRCAPLSVLRTDSTATRCVVRRVVCDLGTMCLCFSTFHFAPVISLTYSLRGALLPPLPCHTSWAPNPPAVPYCRLCVRNPTHGYPHIARTPLKKRAIHNCCFHFRQSPHWFHLFPLLVLVLSSISRSSSSFSCNR